MTIRSDKWSWWKSLLVIVIGMAIGLIVALFLSLIVEAGPIPLEPDRVIVGFKMTPCPEGFTPRQCEAWDQMLKERRREWAELQSEINFTAQRPFEAIRNLNDSLGSLNFAGLWSKVGDTLMQHGREYVPSGTSVDTIIFTVAFSCDTCYSLAVLPASTGFLSDFADWATVGPSAMPVPLYFKRNTSTASQAHLNKYTSADAGNYQWIAIGR